MIIDQLFENNKKPLNEVDPRNFDSDEDYYAAQNAPAKPRYRGTQSPGVNPDDEDYFREIFRKKREAAKKAEQDKEQGVDEDMSRRGFMQGLGMAAAGAAGLGAATDAQARSTPEWTAKVERAKTLMAKGQSREQTARIMGIKGPNPGGTGPMSGDWGAVNYAAQEMRIRESTKPKQRKLNESMLMEDPVYRNFKRIGGYIAERKLTEPEIQQIFADTEAGMTSKDSGANRTMLGRGKDTATKVAGDVSDAVNGVLDGMRTSVPMQAVEVAYDQATDALANVAGGQSGPVMQAIKKYRMLAKQYPKTTGLVKSALIMIAGLASSGVAPLVITGAIGALDRALKGNTLFNSMVGGAADTALAGASRALFGPNPDAFDPGTGDGWGPDAGQVPDADSLAPGEEIAPTDAVPSRFDDIVDNAVDYKVKPDDTLTKILADRKINPEAFKRLPGNEVFFGPDGNPNILKAGQTIKLPDPADINDLNKMNWTTPSDPNLAKDFGDKDFYTGQYNQNSMSGLDAANNLKQQELGRWGSDNGMSAARAAKDAGGGIDIGGSSDLPSNPSAASDYGMGGNAPIDYSQPGPVSTDSLGQKLEYGMPVSDNGSFIPPNPKLPAEELATQQAAYDAWKADFMRRFPNATQLPDGTMQSVKPGLAPMYPSNYTPGMNTNGLTPKAVQESIKFKIMPADKLIDQKSTVLAWALNESIGRKSKSVSLTTAGTYTVFENVDRYRKAILEYTQPGRSELPDLYRPDMPDVPASTEPPTNQSWLGKGIDYLDKGVKKVGGALGNFGHQFTTNVTKEKLKMNWHQKGKPSDSDQLAAWLLTQGVPQEVITSVYGKMGIPYTSGAQRQAYAGKNPATGKPWTVDELQARMNPTATTTTAAATAPATSTIATTTAPATANTNAGGPQVFNAGNVMSLPGMEKYAKKPAVAPVKTPNFAGPSGYGKTTTSFNAPGTAPVIPKAPAGQLSKDEYIKRIGAEAMPESRVASALKKPVAEMLRMVETKEDVRRIKEFIDQTFVKYGAVSESAFVVRNHLIEHVTQVGAQRRREHARKS